MSYQSKITGIESANLIGYWPMDEASGTNADDKSSQDNDGTYTGVTLGETGIGDGSTCPFFDGANDYVDLETAAMLADFDGDHGTVAMWLKAYSVGIWTDSTWRYLFRHRENNNNYVVIARTDADNRIELFRYGNNVGKIVRADGVTTTDWFHLAMTWDDTTDELKVYLDGSQIGTTQTPLAAWTGTELFDSIIGASTTASGDVWHGWIAHVALWTKALTPAQIASLATV